ncbi:hypothetical protein [Methylomonas koyamae]|nr:hypothetical protein [Methylomonas koyamae]
MDGKNEISLTADTVSDVAIPLTFKTDSKDPVSLQINATEFSLGIVDLIKPEFEGCSTVETDKDKTPCQFELVSKTPKRIFLKARFTAAGTYRALVHASLDSEPKKPLLTVVITVTRKLTPPPIEVLGPFAMQIENFWFDDIDTVPLTISIYGTGRQTTISSPQLIYPTWTTKADSPSSISSTMALKSYGDGKNIQVSANETKKFEAKLVNLGKPGFYEAKLRFQSTDYSPIDIPIKIYARRSVWVAFLLVFLGVFLSLIVQDYAGKIRPRLLVQQRVASLLVQLAEAAERAKGNMEAVDIIAKVKQSMQDKWEKARSSRIPITNEFDVYESIIPSLTKWTGLHNQLLAVRPVSVRDVLMKDLDTARDAFIADEPDAATVKDAIDKINKLPKTLRTKVIDALTLAVDTLDAELAKDPRQILVDLRNSLQPVLAKVNSGELDAAVGAFDVVHLRYINIMAADLRARVETPAGQPPIQQPPGLDPEDWKKLLASTSELGEKIRLASKPEKAMDLLVEATQNYLNTFGAAIRRASRDSLPAGSSEVKIENALNEMEVASESKDYKTAWAKLDEARKLFNDAVIHPAGAAMDLGAPVDLVGDMTSRPATAFDIIGVIDYLPPLESLSLSSPTDIAQKIGIMDFVISLIVLVVASIVIVQGVWIDNPSWGGWQAYLTAFVTGFAVDQFTHAGVKALGELRLPRA